MTDREALLRAVGAAPWDDLPRLVFADYLDDHGDADRAAYIRLEVGIARKLAAFEHPTAGELARRKDFAGCLPGWHAGLPALRGVTWGKRFDRGFPVEVTASSLTAFLTHADAIFAAAPIESLKLRSISDGSLDRFRDCGRLSGLRVLDCNGCSLPDNQEPGFGDEPVWRLLGSPDLARLTVLRLSRTGLGDSGAEVIASLPHLAGLTVLDIADNLVTDAGAEVIANSPYLRKVVSVKYDGNAITDAPVFGGLSWFDWMRSVNRPGSGLGGLDPR